MLLNILDVRQEKDWICFRLPSVTEAIRALYQIKGGLFDLITHHEKRGLKANSYAWTLMGKIAAKLCIKDEEVYRKLLRDIDYEVIYVEVEREKWTKVRDSFLEGHIGRQMEKIASSKNYITAKMSYGSSDFDTATMAKFIDSIIQECRELGIETRDQGYIDSLLSAWDDRKKEEAKAKEEEPEPLHLRSKNEFNVVFDASGYAPSIMHVGDCAVCHTMVNLIRHEPLQSANRQKSKEYGLWINLCPRCHKMIHSAAGIELKKEWQRKACIAALNKYGWDENELIRRFGKNYLEGE